MYYIVAINSDALKVEEYADYFQALYAAWYEDTILTESREEAEKYIEEQQNTAAYMVEKLSADRDAWKRRAEAAVNDMAKCCAVCKYDAGSMCVNSNGCRNVSGTNTGWEWRGPCKENGGASDGGSQTD